MNDLIPTPPPAELIEEDGFVTVHPPMTSAATGDVTADPAPVDQISTVTPTYVVFDTENNGLFEYKDPVTKVSIPADAEGQPRLASICAIIADQHGNEISRTMRYIKPDGWSMRDLEHKTKPGGKTASEVNGLTDEFLEEHGVPVVDVLKQWDAWIDQGLIPAAFNAQHDNKQMRAELRRAGMKDRFKETPNTCLMRAMKAYKGQEGLRLNNFGTCKLEVACAFFGIPLYDAHDAEADTVAALGVLKVLLRDGNLIDPKVHYAAKPAEGAA